jgi:hypothetical protein
VEPCDGKWLESLRRHRHDVLNGLQLVKAYLQLGKAEQSLSAVNRLADWLQSISGIQSRGHAPELVRTAMECPHVRVRNLPEPAFLTLSQVKELCRLFAQAEQFASEQNQPQLDIEVQLGQPEQSRPCAFVYIREELFDSWQNEQSETTWQHLEIRLVPVATLQ